MPIQLFPVLVNFIVNARASTVKIVEFLGAVEVDNKRHHLQQVPVDLYMAFVDLYVCHTYTPYLRLFSI